MTREQVRDWVTAYERAWRAPGTSALAEIFTADASYRQGPYEVFRMTSDVVAADGDTAVVRVEVSYGDRVRQEYRDLWIVRFTGDGRCASFEEWPFWPEQPDHVPGGEPPG